MKTHMKILGLLFLLCSTKVRAQSTPYQVRILLPMVSVACRSDVPVQVVKNSSAANFSQSSDREFFYADMKEGSSDIVLAFAGTREKMVIKKSASSPSKQVIEIYTYLRHAHIKKDVSPDIRQIIVRSSDEWSDPVQLDFESDHFAECKFDWTFVEKSF